MCLVELAVESFVYVATYGQQQLRQTQLMSSRSARTHLSTTQRVGGQWKTQLSIMARTQLPTTSRSSCSTPQYASKRWVEDRFHSCRCTDSYRIFFCVQIPMNIKLSRQKTKTTTRKQIHSLCIDLPPALHSPLLRLVCPDRAIPAQRPRRPVLARRG